MREPHDAALIVHACAYLHNLAIDEGLVPLTRETQKDPDMEPLIARNAVTFLLNAVKRNRHRVYKAHYRRQKMSEYLRGVAKRDQILRGQFGERSVRLGYIGPKKKKPANEEGDAARKEVEAREEPAPRQRGRPRKEAVVAQPTAPTRGRGRPRKDGTATASAQPSTSSAGQRRPKKSDTRKKTAASAKPSTSTAGQRKKGKKA